MYAKRAAVSASFCQKKEREIRHGLDMQYFIGKYGIMRAGGGI